MGGKLIKSDFKVRWSLGVVIASLFFAICLAPESPNELASICERHNSEVVCRVW